MQVRSLPSPGDDVVERVVDAIRERTALAPAFAVVLGSGLGTTADVLRREAGSREEATVAYADLPGFPRPSVLGHAGRLWLGEIGGTGAAVFQGRVHYYETSAMPLASITVRVAAALGARSVVLTTATGGIDASLEPGSLVVVRDHLNLMGENPLRGWRHPDGSPPFVDLSTVYDADLSDAAAKAGMRLADDAGADADARVPLREGVYAALSGPSYETPAEVEYLRRIGATVAGMSMVPEAVVARALGLRVLGLSFVTNAAGGPVSHEEVLAASDRAAGAIGRILAAILDRF
jgi:purine-nucleoside phosphorylase